MRTASACLVSIVLSFGILSAAADAEQAGPDLIIYNAKIVTVDGKFSVAQAAAITHHRFTDVGSNEKVLAGAGPGTKKIDLHGETVLPGFDDTHIHQLLSGKSLAQQVNLTNIHSIADIQRAIAAKVKEVKPGTWISGTRGWWEYQLSDGRVPSRYDLDKSAPNNPVTIPGPHYAIVNSLGLKIAGITRDTKNPQGGEIRKDPRTGEPTGQLFDNAAGLIRRFLPKPTHAQMIEGALKTMALDNSNGITSVGEPTGSMADFNLYKELYREGKLTTRVDFGFNINPEAPVSKVKAMLRSFGPPGHHVGDHMMRADEIGETGLDGAEQTAMLREPYPGRPGYKGLQKVSQQQWNQFCLAVDEAGYRLRPHVVGDAAIDEALAGFEYANARRSIVGRRWMMDHDFLLMPDQYPKVKELGLILNSQYMHDAQLGAAILKAWGRPLADKMENYKDWLAHGLMFAGGSDGPISYHALSLYEIYGEVTRKTMWGGELGPEQGITREQAIRTATVNGAYTTFEDKVKGSIEPGKLADFVVLSNDILKVPADDIKNIKVLATVLGGRTVYGKLQ